ncbi:nucleotide sugar dehydrogenase [Paenibacillus barengoltzii]|uniref:nucleotide sugar dehydrogenase n=1 Tax=Paenibacillus barengoltzii TaxID=343517 RepID=UPI000FD9C765|nr:nucleotide sugar dehydrogenase [Paenibacillus barengoltzii]
MKSLCVLGMGYIGLPTAITFAKHGMTVHGVDINHKIIEKLQSGEIHIEEPGLQNIFDEVLAAGNLTFGTTPVTADAYIIAVPTPINPDNTANIDYVRSATNSIIPYLKSQTLVVLESTVPPRTVEDHLIPILSKSHLRIGEELFISHSPERVIPGRLLEELINNDRVIGGINEKSVHLTKTLYSCFVKGNMHSTDATTAEMVKLMENTYRDINIAFANEMALIAEKIGFNVWEAIRLANFHPRVNIHRPGPGVGGHCIAVDPWFIYEQTPELAKLVHTARLTNDYMPSFVAEKTKSLLEGINNPKVAALGLAFKGNVDDTRESPAILAIKKISEFASVSIYDPHVKENWTSKVDTYEECLINADVLLLLTDHDEFKSISPNFASQLMKNKIVFDTRNLLERKLWAEHGFEVHLLGNPSNNLNKVPIHQTPQR